MRYCIQHAHERFVSAMCMLEDGTLLSGGGMDRRLLAWDSLQGYQSAKIERMVGSILLHACGHLKISCSLKVIAIEGIFFLIK